MGKLATYVRPRVFPPLPESPERFQPFLASVLLARFAIRRTLERSWAFTRYEYPRRANRACVFFRVLSCLLVSTSEIFLRFIHSRRMIFRFVESRVCIFKRSLFSIPPRALTFSPFCICNLISLLRFPIISNLSFRNSLVVFE